MITGTIDANLDAIIAFMVLDANGQWTPVDTVIDTGFRGEISLSLALIQSLGLSYLCQNQTMLADGSTQLCDLYEATIDWDGQHRLLSAMAVGPFPLVGMFALEGYRLRMDVKPGGIVTIEPLP